jgi:hypothetical protein
MPFGLRRIRLLHFHREPSYRLLNKWRTLAKFLVIPTSLDSPDKKRIEGSWEKKSMRDFRRRITMKSVRRGEISVIPGRAKLSLVAASFVAADSVG